MTIGDFHVAKSEQMAKRGPAYRLTGHERELSPSDRALLRRILEE